MNFWMNVPLINPREFVKSSIECPSPDWLIYYSMPYNTIPYIYYIPYNLLPYYQKTYGYCSFRRNPTNKAGNYKHLSALQRPHWPAINGNYSQVIAYTFEGKPSGTTCFLSTVSEKSACVNFFIFVTCILLSILKDSSKNKDLTLQILKWIILAKIYWRSPS